MRFWGACTEQKKKIEKNELLCLKLTKNIIYVKINQTLVKFITRALIQFHFQNPTVNMKKSYCNHSNAKSCKKYVTIIGILKTILTPGLSKVAG